MSLTKMVCGDATLGKTDLLIRNVNGLIDFANPLLESIYSESLPAGFNWPVDIPQPIATRIGSQYHCSVKPFDIFNPATISKAYYVDPVYGLNANSGAGANTPVQSIWKAIELMKTQSAGLGARIMVKGGYYPVEHGILASGTTSVDLQSRPMSIESQHGRAIISVSTNLVYTKDAGYTYVYKATSLDSIMALNPSLKSNDGFTYKKYKSVFSIQAVEDTEGSYYYDVATTTSYVHPHENIAASNANVRVIMNKRQLSTVNGLSLFLSGLDMEGGSTGMIYEPNSDKSEGFCVSDNCTFRYQISGTFVTPSTWTVWSSSNFKLIAAFNCDGSRNSRDTFTISKAATNQACSMLTVNCTALNNGLLTEEYSTSIRPSSCNGFTLHNGLKAIDIGSTYTGSAGSNVALVHEDTQAWCFGTIVGDSDGDKVNGKSITYGGFSVSDVNAGLWLDSCEASGCVTALFATSNATIYKRRTIYSGTINTGSGTVVDY